MMRRDGGFRTFFKGPLGMFQRHRQLSSLVLYGAVTTVGFGAGFLLRFEFLVPDFYWNVFILSLPLLLLIRVTLAKALRLSTSRWRFIGTQDMVRLLFAVTTGSLLFYLLTWHLGFPVEVPRSVIALEWVLTAYGTAGMWMSYRLLFQQFRRVDAQDGESERRVLVVGAGEAGAALVGEMKRLPAGLLPVGLVDDDPLKWGSTIHGVEVIGSIEEINAIADVEEAEEIIIGIPSATPAELSRIVERCEGTELSFKFLPGIAEVLRGDAQIQHLRSMQIEDLLGREPIALALPELKDELRHKCVLVTGAAGSIGSELSFQIALHRPQKLVLFDQAETPLVDLDRQLREDFPDLDIAPVIGDIVDSYAVDRLFETFTPHQVFHAAAYKHVPMMETNGLEAIRNNIVGTLVVAQAAGRFGATKFVLVSTDKAVNPVNIMGASKRLSELLILEAQEAFDHTNFAAVRFGNVLGSNGSVIPLFRRQIDRREPLTVTHPDMTRYFMTIPEATQLILQASLLPDLRGRIAMLDMGEPVPIVGLARKILRLSGLPGKIGRDIVFTGLRAGERLHESLVSDDEETVATGTEKVHLVVSRDRKPSGLFQRVRTWAENPETLTEDCLAEVFQWLGGRPVPSAEKCPTPLAPPTN